MSGDPQRIILALTSPLRREILWFALDHEVSAGEIAENFKLAPPRVSQHLSVLHNAGLLRRRVDGKFRYYQTRITQLRGLESLLLSPDRWTPANEVPEAELADASVSSMVTAVIEVPVDPSTVFADFHEAEQLREWLGIDVTREGPVLAATFEWGLRVRGTYEAVVPGRFICLRWDFEDHQVPLPGNENYTYFWLRVTDLGTRVELHQTLREASEATFMLTGWRTVLGRYVEYVTSGPTGPRPLRPKLIAPESRLDPRSEDPTSPGTQPPVDDGPLPVQDSATRMSEAARMTETWTSSA